MQPTIHLGYELGTGEAVAIPARHMIICGQTQEAGKTTTLEALIARSGLPAVSFVTKRGEASFTTARKIEPYFRERADWQFVASVLEASMKEKMKFERAWIVRASKGATTLAGVQRNVQKLMETARGINADVFLMLNEYLEIVVPRIAKVKFATTVDLSNGVNVVDLSDRRTFPSELQSLVMRSVIEWVYENANGTITIIPEAWEFLPQQRGSPVKLAAIELIRKGAGLRNYVWLDSQDIGGIDKEFLRQCPVWLLGVQREMNEIKRTLGSIPAGIAKPRPTDIACLEKGQFYACYGKHVIKVYVQPAWMSEADARKVALGVAVNVTAPERPIPIPVEPTEEPMTEAERKMMDDLRAQNEEYAGEIARLNEFIRSGTRPAPAAEPMAVEMPEPGMRNISVQQIVDTVIALVLKAPAIVELRTTRPEMRLKVETPVIEVDGESLKGKVGLLILGGFFDKPIKAYAAWMELKRLGSNPNKANVYAECDKYAKLGFLTKENDGYKTVPDMKRNIKK